MTAAHAHAPLPGRRRARVGCPLAALACVIALAAPAAHAASLPYATNHIVVGVAPPAPPGLHGRAAAVRASDEAQTEIVSLARGESVATALRRARRRRGVVWAVPDYIAHIAGQSNPSDIVTTTGFLPNDPGVAGVPDGWEQLQWNFVGQFGVDAPGAWSNLIADARPGAVGVRVAVLDTGIAYESRGPYRISPDFVHSQFVQGYDFVAGNSHPDDRNGHGTQVAGTLAEDTDNGVGVTGLAYDVHIMPVRVLNAQGDGVASVIAKGVYYAVQHGAQVLNMSLEFDPSIAAADVPELAKALHYAYKHGVVVVAAAGNEGEGMVSLPARLPHVIAVGSSTEHGCVSNFSNWGPQLAIVAPGGGADLNLPGDPNCLPNGPSGRDIFQETFTGNSPSVFGLPAGYDGTSMATPHVAATAAMIIASGLFGPHPSPDAVRTRLLETARPLGDPNDQRHYGAGLLDAAAATAPGAAVRPPTPAPLTAAQVAAEAI
jgi:serine protease